MRRVRQIGQRLLSRFGQFWGLLIVPAFVVADFVSRRHGRLQWTHDGQLMLGIVENIRAGRGFTSRSDQFWLTHTPADTWAQLPEVPVPDIGPLYTLLAASWPGSPESGMWVINLTALVSALVLVGLLARAGTGRVWIGVVAQLVVVFGPMQQTIFRYHSIVSISGSQGYDILATALALAALLALSRERARWGAALLVMAALARPALAALPLSIAVVYGLSVSGRSSRLMRWSAAAAVTLLAWTVAVWPLIAGSAPKQLHWHPANPAPLANAVLGWFGADFIYERSEVAGVLLCIAFFVVLLKTALTVSAQPTDRLLAITALSVVSLVVLGRTFLVQDMVLSDERHLLLARITSLTFAIRWTYRMVVVPVVDNTDRLRRVSVAVLAAWMLVTGMTSGNRRITRGFDYPALAVDAVAHIQAAADQGAIIISTDPSMLYNRARISSIDVLRTREPSTGQLRDGREEARSLAALGSTAVVVLFDLNLLGLDGPPLPPECAVLVDVLAAAPITVETYDISGCA